MFRPNPDKFKAKADALDEREKKILGRLGSAVTGLVWFLFIAATIGMIWLGISGFPWIYLVIGWLFLFLTAMMAQAVLMGLVLVVAVWFARN